MKEHTNGGNEQNRVRINMRKRDRNCTSWKTKNIYFVSSFSSYFLLLLCSLCFHSYHGSVCVRGVRFTWCVFLFVFNSALLLGLSRSIFAYMQFYALFFCFLFYSLALFKHIRKTCRHTHTHQAMIHLFKPRAHRYGLALEIASYVWHYPMRCEWGEDEGAV